MTPLTQRIQTDIQNARQTCCSTLPRKHQSRQLNSNFHNGKYPWVGNNTPDNNFLFEHCWALPHDNEPSNDEATPQFQPQRTAQQSSFTSNTPLHKYKSKHTLHHATKIQIQSVEIPNTLSVAPQQFQTLHTPRRAWHLRPVSRLSMPT